MKTFKIDHFIRHENPHKHKNIYFLLMALSEERTNKCNWPKCKPITRQELQEVLEKWFINYGHIMYVAECLSNLISSLRNIPDELINKINFKFFQLNYPADKQYSLQDIMLNGKSISIALKHFYSRDDTDILQEEIESLSIDKIRPAPWWITIREINNNIKNIDWDKIILKWLTIYRSNLRVLDEATFYLLTSLNCSPKIQSQWISECIKIACHEKDCSLLETLIRVLGKDASSYEQLIETSIEQRDNYPLLGKALAKYYSQKKGK